MNIFVLDKKPETAAKYHCDKHVIKMCIESAQLLSTAHRLLDGSQSTYFSAKSNKYKKHWLLQDVREPIIYKVAHPHHPATKWVMQSSANYNWLYRLFVALCDEYTFRYNKTIKTDLLLRDILANLPANIPVCSSDIVSNFVLAMKSSPECMDHSDPIESYRKFYMTKTKRFGMNWTRRRKPLWFK